MKLGGWNFQSHLAHNVLQVYLVADLEAQNFKLRRNEIRSTKL
jgi:hypothetical protein